MDVLELTLVILVLIYLGVFLIHILYVTRKLDPRAKKYHYGIACFVIFFIITRILFIINDLVVEQTGDLSQKHGIYYILGSFFSALGAFAIMLVVEIYIIKKKLRFIPSIVILIGAVLMITIPKVNGENMVTYYTVLVFIGPAIIPFLYIYVGYQTSGHTRSKSYILAIGLIVFFIGNIFNMGLLKDAYPIFLYISPITLLVGFLIFHYGLLIYESVE